MTLLPKPLTMLSLQRELPKKCSHVKEQAKVKFIREAIRLFQIHPMFGGIDFNKSLFDGENWALHIEPGALSLAEVIEQILSKWYFSNLAKNENVYFYRFLNIVRADVSAKDWQSIVTHLLHSSDATLKSNVLAYLDYRDKLDAIDQMLSDDLNLRRRKNVL